MKKKAILKDISLVVISNAVTMVTAMVITVILPKYIGVLNFSYWQLYVFYSTYAVYLQFGWIEGIYLKEGGKEYDKLDFARYGTQIRLLLMWGLLLSSIFIILIYFSEYAHEKKIILILVSFYIVIVFARTFVLYIFQATGKIKQYMQINIVDRVVFILGCTIMLLCGVKWFAYYIVLELMSKAISTVLGYLSAKDIIFAECNSLVTEIKEIIDNIKIGIKLMIAVVSGLLINGIMRFGIEQHWGVEVFGRISFTISLSNIVISFIGAISVVFFPLLRNIKDKKKLVMIYEYMNLSLFMVCFFVLAMYYPIKIIANLWLPDYKKSVTYMAIIFPLCFFESKMSIIVTTYLKALRKEDKIMVVNLISIFISLIFTFVSIHILNSLTITIFLLLIISVMKCNLGEMFLSRELYINRKTMLYELFLTIVFVLSNWLIGGIKGFWIYLLVFAIFVGFNINSIKKCILYLIKKE